MSSPNELTILIVNREILQSAARALNIALPELNIADLRRVFSEVFDEMSKAVLQHGLDLDDVVFERSLECATKSGRAFEVLNPALSDIQRLSDAILQIAPTATTPGNEETDITIVGLKVVVIRDLLL